MQVRGWPSILVLAVFSCFAIACGIFVLVAKTQQAQAVVAAIFLLSIGQLFVIGLGWARGLTLQDAIRSLARERRAAEEKYNKSFVATKIFENEIADLKRRMGLSEKEIQDEMITMRARFQELTQRYEAEAANARAQSAAEVPLILQVKGWQFDHLGKRRIGPDKNGPRCKSLIVCRPLPREIEDVIYLLQTHGLTIQHERIASGRYRHGDFIELYS